MKINFQEKYEFVKKTFINQNFEILDNTTNEYHIRYIEDIYQTEISKIKRRDLRLKEVLPVHSGYYIVKTS